LGAAALGGGAALPSFGADILDDAAFGFEAFARETDFALPLLVDRMTAFTFMALRTWDGEND